MKKKALALAVAGAFFAPASYAAQDTSGMQYTSAAEGFYASIRTKFSTESSTDGGAGIDASSSRFGVRGSNDLGNGLQGFYQYEAGFGQAQKDTPSLRVGQVGLEGSFGRVWAGSGWVETYNMAYGSTDIANNGSGALVYDDIRPGRDDHMIQYSTPDISGFRGAFAVKVKGGADNDARMTYRYTQAGVRAQPFYFATAQGTAVEYDSSDGKFYQTVGGTTSVLETVSPDKVEAVRDANGVHTGWRHATETDAMGNALTLMRYEVAQSDVAARYGKGESCGTNHFEQNCAATPTSAGDDNDVDMWSLAAQYSVQGFTGAFAYSVRPDVAGQYKEVGDVKYVVSGGRKEDRTAWTARVGYAQDNWYVNGWYGKDNDSDLLGGGAKDTKHTSIAGGVSVGAVNMYAVWENTDHLGTIDDATTVIGIQYNLGSNSRAWMDYVGKDLESNAKAEDHINIGLRHDF